MVAGKYGYRGNSPRKGEFQAKLSRTRGGSGWPLSPVGICGSEANPDYFFVGRTGAENCSVRSRSVMSTTVSIGATSS